MKRGDAVNKENFTTYARLWQWLLLLVDELHSYTTWMSSSIGLVDILYRTSIDYYNVNMKD